MDQKQAKDYIKKEFRRSNGKRISEMLKRYYSRYCCVENSARDQKILSVDDSVKYIKSLWKK